MPQNQFLPFAIGTGANTLSAASYAARAEIAQGIEAGTAASILFNTNWRQSSTMASMIGQFIADHQTGDVLDNGVISALETQFIAALQSSAGTTRLSFGTDTGTANALVVATTPTFTSLSPGQIVIVTKGSSANTGTATIAFNGGSPVTPIKASGGALLAGDLPANTELIFGVDASSNLRLLSTGYAISDIAALAAGIISSNILGDGQCRLSVLNSTTLKLSPFAGSSLIINGVYQALPTAGITLQLIGPSPNTLYYIYAYMNGSTMALEGSTTGHTTDAYGRENKTGDVTRRLLGMVYTNGASQFVNTATQPFLINYFNRKDQFFSNTGSPVTTTTSNVVLQIGPLQSLLTWADDPVTLSATSFITSTAGTQGIVAIQNYIDGSAAGSSVQLLLNAAGTAGVNVDAPFKAYLSEGVHIAQVQVTTANNLSSNSATLTPTVVGSIRG